MSVWSDAYLPTLRVLNSISIALAALVMLTYALFKWKFPHRMAFAFSFSTLGLSVFQLITAFIHTDDFTKPSNIYDPRLCVMQGIGIQFFANALVYWWFAIVVHMFFVVALRRRGPHEFFYHLGVWGISAVLTAVPLAAGKIGPSSLWCWIVQGDDDPYNLWEFGGFYLGKRSLLFFFVFLARSRSDVAKKNRSFGDRVRWRWDVDCCDSCAEEHLRMAWLEKQTASFRRSASCDGVLHACVLHCAARSAHRKHRRQNSKSIACVPAHGDGLVDRCDAFLHAWRHAREHPALARAMPQIASAARFTAHSAACVQFFYAIKLPSHEKEKT
jgi:hypothetical protein